MNDAGDNHNMRLPWLRGLLPEDGGDLTPAQAIRRFGPPELVAEMDRLVESETARLFPPPKPAGETEWDRKELNRWLATKPPLGERERNLELDRVATVVLSDCQMDLWRHLKAEGTAGRLLFSYQPTDPAAARVTIATDRCRYLTVLSPGTLFEGVLADAIHSGLRTSARPDTLRLDGHELWHARVRPASEDAAIRARLAGLKHPPTYKDARILAKKWGVSQRAVWNVVQALWPETLTKGRRRKAT